MFFLPPVLLSCFSGYFKFVVPFFEYLLLATFQLSPGSDVAQRAVEPLIVVKVNIVRHLSPGFVKRQRHFGPDAFMFDGLVETFQFAVALRVVGRCPHMGHPCHPDKFFEVLGYELGTIVRNNPRGGMREVLSGSLQDYFNVSFGHCLAQFPVDDVATTTVQKTAQIVKGSANIDVGNINMPVLVGLKRLNKAGPFLGCLAVPAPEQLGSTQDTINAAGTDGNNIPVEHHIGQATIALQRMLLVKIDDCLPLPILQPEIARNGGIVIVGFAVALLPIVIFTGCQA